MAAAAFFDLDRTLLRRSSALALAGTFRDRGLISRRQLAKAANSGVLVYGNEIDAALGLRKSPRLAAGRTARALGLSGAHQASSFFGFGSRRTISPFGSGRALN